MARTPKPPRRPFFGIRLSPVGIITVVLLLVALCLLICFLTDLTFFPKWRPNGFWG